MAVVAANGKVSCATAYGRYQTYTDFGNKSPKLRGPDPPAHLRTGTGRGRWGMVAIFNIKFLCTANSFITRLSGVIWAICINKLGA